MFEACAAIIPCVPVLVCDVIHNVDCSLVLEGKQTILLAVLSKAVIYGYIPVIIESAEKKQYFKISPSSSRTRGSKDSG